MLSRKLLIIVSLFFCFTSFDYTTFASSTKIDRKLTVAIPSDIISFDPIRMDDVYSYFGIHQVLESLFGLNQYGEIVPVLIRKWKYDEKKKIYHFVLKEGVIFHNGKNLTVEDVIYSFNRVVDKSQRASNSWVFDTVKRIDDKLAIKKVGKFSFEIHLKKHTPIFIDLLASPYTAIIPSNSGKEFHLSPVGTGPYVFTERKKGEYIDLKAFKKYHGEKADAQNVRIKIILGYKGISDLINSDQIDIAALFDGNMLKTIKADRIEKKLVYQYTTWFLTFNQSDNLLKEKRFREAIEYAIDKNKLVKILGGKDTPTNHYIPPGFMFEPKMSFSSKYDPKKANRIIKELGISKEKKVKLVIPAKFLQLGTIVKFFKDSFTRADIPVDIEILPLGKIIPTLIKKTFQINLLELLPGYSDPDSMLYPYFYGKGGINVANHKSKYLDSLLDNARYSKDFSKRKELYTQIDDYIVSNKLVVPLYHENIFLLYSKEISNINVHGLGLWFLKLNTIKF